MLVPRPPRVLAAAMLGTLLIACGGGPAVLDSAEDLDAADRARIMGFETTLSADRIDGLVPARAPQRIDLRPGALVESGLGRYLPVLSKELAQAMRAFEDESGVPALEAFDRLLFWSEAPTIDALDRSRTELLFAFDGATLVSLIEWLEGDTTPDRTSSEAHDDSVYAGGMFIAAFSPLEPAQLAKVRAVMEEDPQRVQTYVLGPQTRLVTARGTEGDSAVAWSMWAYTWPGGFIVERSLGNELLVPTRALSRLAMQLRRIEAAAVAPPPPALPDRVLTARMRGPDPIAVDLDMGETVGMRVAAPTALFDLEMPPSMLVAAWPMMKLTLIQGMGQALERGGVGADFGPLLSGVIRASELQVRGDRLVWSTALPRRAFEALLPTM